ncbi:MAG: hypothetical protein WAW96_20215 [Alphaproteobacteria bacterium]
MGILLALAEFPCCAHGPPVADKPTPIDQCTMGKECLVEGFLVATEKKGSIRVAANQNASGCIAVALRADVPESWNLRHVKAIGMVSRRPNFPGMFSYKLKDRVIDAEACQSDLAMYVDRIETVD